MGRSGGSNISLRAAQYFGLADRPRASFLLARREVLIVSRTNVPGVTWLAYYEERERGAPTNRCNVISLIDEQRNLLAAALS